MNYIFIETETEVSLDTIRFSHPNISIADGADLTHLGYQILNVDPQPEYDISKQIISGPIEKRDGEWFKTWQVKPLNIVPQSVSMGQARLAVFDLGKLDDVMFILNSLPEPQKQRALIEWEYRPTVDRNSPLVLQLGLALDLDLDALFTTAAAL